MLFSAQKILVALLREFTIRFFYFKWIKTYWTSVLKIKLDFKNNDLFIYYLVLAVLSLYWCVGFSLAVVRRGYSSWSEGAFPCSGFSCHGAWVLGHIGFHICRSWVLQSGLNSCRTQAYLFHGMRMAGGFFTTDR